MKPTRAQDRPTLSELLDRDFHGMPALDADDREDDPIPRRLWEQALLGPLRDFLDRPGKQFRSRLSETAWVIAGGDAAGLPGELPLVVEMLHAGSLVVDDIEDGSTTRRGAPALHERWGVPIALNTGNWLYFWPHLVLARLRLPAARRLRLYEHAAVSLLRCHQGQALDLSVRVFELSRAEAAAVVATVTRLKTGSLTELAAVSGAVAAGAGEDLARRLARFGRDAGIGLQMLDDLAGVLGARRRAEAEADLRLARPTWLWAWLAEVEDDAGFASAVAGLREVVAGADAGPLLESLGRRVGARGLVRARDRLARALGRVAGLAGPAGGRALDRLRRDIARLEEDHVGR